MKSFTLIILLFLAIGSSAQDLPIFTEELKPGVYKTFEEFKFNNPSITDSIYVEMIARKSKNWEGTFESVPRYFDNNKKIKKAWGFCDGEKAYLFHQLEFFDIDFSDDRLRFEGYGLMNNSAGTTGAILGGALGYGIAQASVVAKAKKSKIRYHINQVTGEINQLSAVAYEEITEQPDVYIVFYRYGKKEIPGAVSITVNDSINIALEPYAYDQIKFKVSGDPVKIDYDNGSATIYVDIKSEENKYVEVSNSTKLKKEKLIEWEEVTGDFYAKKAKARQLERGD